MRWVDEDGTLHIELSEAAEEILDVFNRAQAGELGPFAKYIEDGKPLIKEMRLFLAAYLRGEIKWKKGRKKTIDNIVNRNRNLRRMREIKKMDGINKEEAIANLSEELNISAETLVSQIRLAEKEENGPFEVGPQYRSD
jgi:hypothetical protein